MCGICSKMEIKTLERRLSGVAIANFKEISCIILVFPLLILNKEILVVDEKIMHWVSCIVSCNGLRCILL